MHGASEEKAFDPTDFENWGAHQGTVPRRVNIQAEGISTVSNTGDLTSKTVELCPVNDSKPQVPLPGPGRQKSEFSADMAAILGPLHVLFQRDEIAVELVMEEFDDQLDDHGLAHGGFKFRELDPCRATTWVEDYVVIGRHHKNERNN